MNQSWVVGHDVEEIARLLQSADEGLVCARQNPDDAAFRPRCACPRKFGAANNPCDYTIAMHGRAGVFSRDEKIGLARFFIGEKSVAGLMHTQRSGQEIRCIRLDVSIFPDSSDFAFLFKIAQCAAHLISLCRAVTERVCDFDFVERPIFRITNEP